jgi:hypothetical protein
VNRAVILTLGSNVPNRISVGACVDGDCLSLSLMFGVGLQVALSFLDVESSVFPRNAVRSVLQLRRP